MRGKEFRCSTPRDQFYISKAWFTCHIVTLGNVIDIYICYGVSLKCPLKTHMLKESLPAYEVIGRNGLIKALEFNGVIRRK